ncbi:aquaporin [Agromyces sp. SYSU T0242]|uniref:aquaporin n=1 Tax=Agromyces litoreus TaxID=3158561 RepID=UPI003393C42E
MSDAPASATPTIVQRLAAEALGTFVLVFGLIGTGLYAAAFAGGEGGMNVGLLGVAIALGMSVIAAAFTFGPVSGGHFNPAVSIGLAVAGRFAWKDVAGYAIAQAVGGLVAASALAAILVNGPAAEVATAFRGVSTGFDALSPAGFGLGAFLVAEVLATAVLVLVILGATSARGAGALAPIAIGFTLTAMALAFIPVSNASFNPARSLATAVFAGGEALTQLWASFAAPIAGAAIAGLLFRVLFERPATLSRAADAEAVLAA